MAFTNSYDSTKPDCSTTPTQFVTEVRVGAKDALRERLDADHDFSTANINDDTLCGKHKVVHLLQQASDPTVAADEGALYTKETASKAELYYKDEDGNTVALTSGGQLNVGVDGTTLQYSSGTLSVKDGGIDTTQLADDAVTAAKLADDAVDTDAIQDSAVTTAKIANDAVDKDKVTPGSAGADADYYGVAVTACGTYSGASAGKTVTPFPSGVQITHIVIRRHDAATGTGGVEAIKGSDGNTRVWKQKDNTVYEQSEFTIGTNSFTMNGVSSNDDYLDYFNKAGENYSYVAHGVWAS